MKKKEKLSIDKRLEYKNFLYGISNTLSRKGLEIRPYYWMQEYVGDLSEPRIQDAASYELRPLTEEDLRQLADERSLFQLDDKLGKLQRGADCLALVQDGKIAAYSWIEYGTITFRKRTISLTKHQAYLGGMFTITEFRGRNLAAYLRYLSYQVLEEKGISEIFSISDAWNGPALRFKEKLKAVKKASFFYLRIGKNKEVNYRLREYRN